MKPRPIHPQNTVEPPDALATPPKIRPIESHMGSDGFELTQYHRVGSVAIYTKTKDQYSGFEVIIIKTSRPHYLDTNAAGYDWVENYPTNRQWGEYGWSYSNFEAAKERFMSLVNTDERKE